MATCTYRYLAADLKRSRSSGIGTSYATSRGVPGVPDDVGPACAVRKCLPKAARAAHGVLSQWRRDTCTFVQMSVSLR